MSKLVIYSYVLHITPKGSVCIEYSLYITMEYKKESDLNDYVEYIHKAYTFDQVISIPKL